MLEKRVKLDTDILSLASHSWNPHQQLNRLGNAESITSANLSIIAFETKEVVAEWKGSRETTGRRQGLTINAESRLELIAHWAWDSMIAIT